MLINLRKIKIKNGNEVVLKSPIAENAQIVLDHLKNVFRDSYRNMNHPKDHWDQFSVDEEAKILQEFAGSSNKFMVSAFLGERIVGNLGCFGMGGEFLKFNARIGMGIETEFQGLGIGTALLTVAIETARELKFRRLELSVRTFNEPGIKLYENCGFKKIGTAKSIAYIDGNFYDEFLYELIF